MKIFNWIKKKKTHVALERTFSDLRGLGESNPHARRTYELLTQLSHKTAEAQAEPLISALQNIRFASNTGTVFFFYFPMVAHILYYLPRYEGELLHHLIGPNFANGPTETPELMAMIPRAMDRKLSENKHFMTREGRDWVRNVWPKMEKEVEREVQLCWKELDE